MATTKKLQRVVDKIKLKGSIRDFNFIVRQYEKGRLYIGGEKVSSKNKFEQFRLLVRLLNEIYEGRWDLDFDLALMGNTKVILDIKGPIIHFPDITISNKDNKSHNIKDLFVRIYLSIRNNNLHIAEIQGGRSTYTYKELSSDYSHSHLPGVNMHSGKPLPYFTRFCTGSGHINDFISEINCGEVTETNLTRLLVQIMGLVSYESIEGTPHRNIKNIIFRTQNSRTYYSNPSRNKQLYQRLLDAYRSSNVPISLEFVIENNKYILKNDEKFESFLSDTVNFDNTDNNAFLCIISESGEIYAYGSSGGPINLNLPTNDSFIFRNEVKSLVVLDTPTEVTNIEYKIHPSVKEDIKKEIEYDINKKIIRKSTIDRYSN